MADGMIRCDLVAASTWPRGPFTTACKECSTPFTWTKVKSGRDRQFCKSLCRKKHSVRKRASEGHRVLPRKNAAQHRGRPIRANPVIAVRPCENCGEPFEVRQDNHKTRTCGFSCGSALGRRRATAESTQKRTCICAHCHEPFVKARTTDPGKYCSRKCLSLAKRTFAPDVDGADARRRLIDKRKQRRKRLGVPPAVWAFQRRCAVCPTIFTPIRDGDVTCSVPCRRKRRIAREPDRTCGECRKLFRPSTMRAVYCSTVCGSRHARRISKASRRAREVARKRLIRASEKEQNERVDPFVVFDRDGWHCRLCGIPTPRELRGTYKMNAPELDHIIPVWMGGPHTYSNTQCACRECNLRKGGTLTGVSPSCIPLISCGN